MGGVHVTLVSGIDPGVAAASGTRSYVLGLAERLPSRGVPVSLIARNGSAAPPGIAFTGIRSGPSSAQFLLRLAVSAPRLRVPSDSIIHTQRPDDLVPFLIAKRRNPKVCTLHGIPAIAIRRRKGAGYGYVYRTLERFGLRRANRLIAVSRGTAQWYAARYPWIEARTNVVPVGVDTTLFRPGDKDVARRKLGVTAGGAIAFAGRLSPEKRVHEVVRAVRDLSDTELLVAGGGTEERRARELAQGARVRFLGTLAREEMPTLLNAVDLLILPSEYEGLPTIAIESLACGTPIIATHVGGLPELVLPGKTGWLVEDIHSLTSTIREGLPLARAMRADCVAAARRYSWDVVIDKVLATYREAEAAG